ncbi:discoidin domain-containing protein [Archangium lansingense]|uniref:discoidin domain-containing protein n=1 Tax=Archangium lansingense TaxID=2995310 RepID=UPI003B7837ED
MKRLHKSLGLVGLSLSVLAGCGAPEGSDASLGSSPSELQAQTAGAALTADCTNPIVAPLAISGVTASAHDGNVPANVLDGNLSTRWSCNGMGCWLTADLGAEKTVSGVELAWYLGDRRTSKFEVSVSRDGSSYTRVAAGTSSGKTLQPERTPFAAVPARYVKLTVNGNSQNTWASLSELHVLGTSCTPSTGGGIPTTDPAPTPGRDVFGSHEIYPTVPNGRMWSAKWNANPRKLSAGQDDPYDAEFHMRGSNHTLDIRGDGTAKSAGSTIRFYLSSPGKTWFNTELTIYARRVSEQSNADSSTGFEFQARTADGHTEDGSAKNAAGLPQQCDGHSYGYSLRYDGRALFEKELRHPTYTSQVSRNIWSGGALPRNQWIGIKVITYSKPDGGVKLELWRDLTDGADGGKWEKVHEYTDVGGWSISPSVAASCAIPADFRITTPQPIFIIRNSNIAEQWYKKATLREIVPPAQ